MNNIPNSNIKMGMYKNENDMSQITLRRILYVIIFILVVVIVILLIKGKPKELICENENEVFVADYNLAKQTNIELGKEMYYNAKDAYSSFILDTNIICGTLDKATTVDNYFMKSTNTKFTTYPELESYVKSYFYGDLVTILLSPNKFKNVGGSLYCVEESRAKNVRYIGAESINLINREANRMEYKVKEKYFATGENLDCLSNCNYEYKENLFVVEKKDERWLVTEFVLPY